MHCVWLSQKRSIVACLVNIIFFIFYRYTSKNETVYAITLEWPNSGTLQLGAPLSTKFTTVTLVGYKEGAFSWRPASALGGLLVKVPAIAVNDLPCKWAWVFKLENVL